MRMSDLVAQHILEMLEEQNGNAEIRRNELAGTLGCVPSQINYVITSRFTPEQGYIVESRRGGGGYIRITRVKMDKSTALMHIVNSIGATLDKASAEVMIKNMYNQSIIDVTTAKLLMSAMSERIFVDIPQNYRDVLRARIFKNMILTLCD
ncbi:MAG: CtsR family transcriptional regulator [Ruminococcus sp.]